jgi:hypothetical protein
MPSSISSDAASSLYEKSDSVLWAFTPDGIVLHNFETSSYLELKGDDYIAWSYFDGVHTLSEIAGKLSSRRGERNKRTAITKVRRALEKLNKGGFVVGRSK